MVEITQLSTYQHQRACLKKYLSCIHLLTNKGIGAPEAGQVISITVFSLVNLGRAEREATAGIFEQPKKWTRGSAARAAGQSLKLNPA